MQVFKSNIMFVCLSTKLKYCFHLVWARFSQRSFVGNFPVANFFSVAQSFIISFAATCYLLKYTKCKSFSIICMVIRKCKLKSFFFFTEMPKHEGFIFFYWDKACSSKCTLFSFCGLKKWNAEICPDWWVAFMWYRHIKR